MAFTFYERACDGGSALGCDAAARLLRTGAGDDVPRDPARAIAFLEKACDRSSGEACASLGKLYGDGVGVTADGQKSRELFERACALGNPDGCDRLGRALYYGKAGREPARAIELLARACDAQLAASCDTLADILTDASEPLRDPSRGVPLLERLCMAEADMEDPDPGGRPHFWGHLACWRLGKLYRDGNGVPRDTARALRCFDRGGAVCEALALRYQLGELKPPSAAEIRRDDLVRVAVIKAAVGRRGTVCVALMPCGAPSPFLVARLKRESITVTCGQAPDYFVYPVEWRGDREAVVRAGFPPDIGAYVLRRNLLRKWRVVARPLFE